MGSWRAAAFSPTRRPLLVEGVQPFLGVLRLDDVADGLDHVLDRAAILKSLARMNESRARRITTGDFDANSRARARASSLTRSCGTTRFTSPCRSASDAETGLPPNSSSKALCRPI